MLTLFHSFINSHLMYCLPAWSCGLESSLNPLIILQKKAIRIVTNSRYNSHTAPLFKDLKILPLKELTIHSKLLIMYDFICWRLPFSFDGMWKRNSFRQARIMRNADEFNIPISKFTSIERFPLFHFQKLWNDICYNTDDLSSEQPRSIFAENIKEELFKSVITICNNQHCRECR